MSCGTRHTSIVPGKAEHANMNGRGVRTVGVAAPVPAVTEHGDPAHVDINALGT